MAAPGQILFLALTRTAVGLRIPVVKWILLADIKTKWRPFWA
ncbi:hypothetical protein [Leptospira interrogans]|nr:hypothetical protein [Leptospira interrogans]